MLGLASACVPEDTTGRNPEILTFNKSQVAKALK